MTVELLACHPVGQLLVAEVVGINFKAVSLKDLSDYRYDACG
jgi:hypothetical protein